MFLSKTTDRLFGVGAVIWSIAAAIYIYNNIPVITIPSLIH